MTLHKQTLRSLFMLVAATFVRRALPPDTQYCAGYPYQRSLLVVRSINGLSVEAHSVIGPPSGTANPCSFWTKSTLRNPANNRVDYEEDCPYQGGDLCTVSGSAIAVAELDLNGEAGTYNGTGEYAVFNDVGYPGIWSYPSAKQGTLSSACGNTDKDLLLNEYYTPPWETTEKPACGDFVINVSTAHFSYSELNSGYFQHSILRGTLLAGSECIWTQHGGTPVTVNSGFRNPSKNAAVPSVPNSRHVYGDAIDFHAPAGSHLRQNSWNFKLACGACREPLTATPTWVHYDWRGGCPTGW